ncbi:uncharacterized protein LOC109823120 [Asparagus officinalis]|uniref:uncharacterized protein LOC109823120 n=1 Tax=Asparagus officinalis TaxID=4686 RepID=UPI00098E1443|nr:uncharacterized protein LOC109823120 [Asparagus officinalis]
MSRVEYSASNEEHNIEESTGEFDGTHDDNGQTQKKRGRGYDKPKWGKSGKESIAFTEDGLCVDPKDAQLSRYLGSLAKNSRFLPLKPIDWRLHDDTTMDHVWKTIYDTIDWRPEDVPNIPKIRLVMLQIVCDRCRNYKASLKAKYYTPYVGLPERFLCGDDRVDRDQWRAMVNYWDTDPKNKMYFFSSTYAHQIHFDIVLPIVMCLLLTYVSVMPFCFLEDISPCQVSFYSP